MLCVVTHNQSNGHFLKTDLPLKSFRRFPMPTLEGVKVLPSKERGVPHGYGAEAIRVLVEIMSDAMAPHPIREAVCQARRDVD